MKKVLLGVTSSIAAYRAQDLVRLFVKGGYSVQPILTRNSLNFVTPLSFSILSGNRAMTDDAVWDDLQMAHIDMKKDAALLLVAPATANIIGKMAGGIADDLLSTTFLAVRCPVLVAPAMNPDMFANVAVQENLEILKRRGVRVVEPVTGEVICGDEGPGRLARLEDIYDAAVELLGKA